MSTLYAWYAHISALCFTLSAALCWLLFTLGQQIRRIRLAHGLSQERLAELLDVHSRTVQRWEKDEMVPRISHLYQMQRLNFSKAHEIGHLALHQQAGYLNTDQFNAEVDRLGLLLSDYSESICLDEYRKGKLNG